MGAQAGGVGCKVVVPNPVQVGISNFFYPLHIPPRFSNNILQGKLRGVGMEISRFLVNSTLGFAGFVDEVSEMDLKMPEEDTGQTLGFYGVNPGSFLVLPLLQPFTVRDFDGLLGGSERLGSESYFIRGRPTGVNRSSEIAL